MRIVLSGGGTGGHLTPVLAAARQLRNLKPNAQIYFVGQGREMSDELSKLGVTSYHVMSGKWRRYHNQGVLAHLLDVKTTLLNIVDFFKFLAGIIQSFYRLVVIRPDVVFTKGGFASLPVGLVAMVLRKKLIIHESDVTPGLANRILARFADCIATGFPVDNYRRWQNKELVYTGNPIRDELLVGTRAQGLEAFSLDPNMPTLLVMGGSGGARAINEAVMDQITGLSEHCQVLHVVGRRDFGRIKEQYDRLKPEITSKYQVFDFLAGNLASALAASDIVLSRAGANTLAELAALSKPTVVVPSPFLVGGHQLHNTQVLKEADAVVALPQKRLGELTEVVSKLIADEQQRRKLARNFARFAKPNAAEQLAKKIVQLAEGE